MHYSLRHGNTFPAVQLYGSILEINEWCSFKHEEEFVIVVMFMPVVLAWFENAQSQNRVIDAAQCLVEPRMLVLGDKSGDIDFRKGRKLDVEACVVGIRSHFMVPMLTGRRPTG